LVAYLLDVRHAGVEALLSKPIDPAPVERELRDQFSRVT